MCENVESAHRKTAHHRESSNDKSGDAHLADGVMSSSEAISRGLCEEAK